ncbi:MAG: glycoside hydrolase family 127 protein [Saccharofermentans sp.]|nr:glycoside hydrolase family 127 protein [Saccharofermentans sp.]
MNGKSADIKSVKINDLFWSSKMELIRKEVLPYQWDILNDRVPQAAPSYCMHNFKAAGRLNRNRKTMGKDFKEPVYTYRGFEALPEDPSSPKEDEFYGFVFQDSDFSKWIEAVGYSLAVYPDDELEKIADEAIDIVCEAQLPNGYLDTYYIINGMDRSFKDLRDHHELYCLGHLIEGAISYYQGTGKDKLLKAACSFADYVDSVFGYEEGKIKGYPGHEIAEMALFKLYETTGEERYKKLAEYFINERGQAPLYFDMEHPTPKGQPYKIDYYHQAHIPVREQTEAVGHAVRAVYLYSGMADMARISKDERLLNACDKLWDSITREKMYITGGIGATHLGEAFSFPFDLPNDTDYAETCASIGLVFFARRMLQIKADRKYSDVMELALFNGILSGIALDGKSFFYVNPLEVIPEACKKDERKMHIKSVRQKWFGCACCPPNLARLVASIGTYAYTTDEDTLFVHLYMGSEFSHKDLSIRTESSFPDSGKVKISAQTSGKSDAVLALRIPSWCNDKYDFKSDRELSQEYKDGYLYLKGFEDDTVIEIDFDMTSRIVVPDNRVREDLGRAALVRGPVVYCMEEKDNGKDLASLYIDATKEIREEETMEFGLPVTALIVSGYRKESSSGNDYVTPLYKGFEAIVKEEKEIRFIPYRLWANRGEGEMSVYINI